MSAIRGVNSGVGSQGVLAFDDNAAPIECGALAAAPSDLLSRLHTASPGLKFEDQLLTILRTSRDSESINQLLEEILQNDTLRLEVLRNRAIHDEILVLCGSERLSDDVIWLLIDSDFFRWGSEDGAHLDALIKVDFLAEDSLNEDLLAYFLSHDDESIRARAKKYLCSHSPSADRASNSGTDELIDAFIDHELQLFELRPESLSDEIGTGRLNKEKLARLQVILSDQELKNLFRGRLIAICLEDDGSLSYDRLSVPGPDDENLPIIKDPELINMFLGYFGTTLDEIFSKRPPAARNENFEWHFKVILRNISLFNSAKAPEALDLATHFRKFLEQSTPSFVIRQIDEIQSNKEDKDSLANMREFLVAWFNEAPTEYQERLAKKLITRAGDLLDGSLAEKLISIWLQNLDDNRNLLRIMKSDDFEKLMSMPSFVKIFSESLEKKCHPTSITFAHHLVSLPRALELVLANATAKKSLKQCLEIKDDRTQTVRKRLLSTPDSLAIAKKTDLLKE